MRSIIPIVTLNLPLLKDVWNDTQGILDEFSEENGDFVLGGLEYSELRNHLPYLLQEMMEGASRIKDIVSRLKDYSLQSAEDGREHVELNSVVRGALTFVRHKIQNSAQNFELVLPEESPMVDANPQRLIQVLINIIVNSCESLPKNNGILTVTVKTCRNEINENNYACITVKDNGCGIPEQNLKYIEDPFFTTKRDSGGTGLGLSISSSIMKEHGGLLEFTSKNGKGTTATMRLPLSL